MVVYLDLAFLLNCLSDGAALYITAQVSGRPVDWRRLLPAAAAGGTYGALCAVPSMQWAASFFPQTAAAALLVWLAFGKQKAFLRCFLLFFMLSCTMGGVLLVTGRLLSENGALLRMLNWRVFFLAGGVCFFTLSVIFRGGARHAAAGHICRGTVTLRGRQAELTVLLDTGHTLTDALTSRPVLTVCCSALDGLWTDQEKTVLSRLEQDGAARCLEQLGPGGAGFRLLPYQAVGVSAGLLLCFRADRVCLDGRELGNLTVALSPTQLCGGTCHGLWGGEKEESCCVT
ncbi:MAG: sigma-E processing peptidase SpoIIGA [Oscillospiraceae bacterium]|nr:sigma-E processing peptidase SpoIIGA [Oscillospiraceae bacterium]